MSVHGSQIKIGVWKYENARIERELETAHDDGEIERLERERDEIDKEAIRDNVYDEYKYIVVRFENVRSRHTRENDNKKTYTVYFAIDVDCYWKQSLGDIHFDGLDEDIDINAQNDDMDDIKMDNNHNVHANVQDAIGSPFHQIESNESVDQFGV
eukprot:447006_1